ncbi:unnamed protein product [Paramecium pentaurelia]|uniref:LRAT domain-containing protein n=1 Tax=Paramecium pentaurelia TaxID=43138 RepID=A0A8S1Y8X2_9CILI|nr:unnamed protein product [Paramecium pentaurelia]
MIGNQNSQLLLLKEEMKGNINLLTQCKKSEILEFNHYYVGLQYLFCLVHKLKILIIDKTYTYENMSLLQSQYLNVHYGNQQIQTLYDEYYYSEKKALSIYEEMKQKIIEKYSEQNTPILNITNEIKGLQCQYQFNLFNINIKDQHKLDYSNMEQDLSNNVLFMKAMQECYSNYDNVLDSFIAIQTQQLIIKTQLHEIIIIQYWLLKTQIYESKEKDNKNDTELVISKYKNLNYFLIVNQQKYKIEVNQQKLELFIFLLNNNQFEEFIEQKMQTANYFEPLNLEYQHLDDSILKVQYYQFKDCTFRIVQKLNDEFNQLIYSIEILGIENKFYSVIDTENIQQLELRLKGFPQQDLSIIFKEPDLIYKYFMKKIYHNINPESDPYILSNKIKVGSIILSDRSIYQHAALYLGCDLVFHYTNEQFDNINQTRNGHFFKPERFVVFMKGTSVLTELQLIFLLRDKQELLEKALKKSNEKIQFDLTNYNCEHMVFEILTNFKYSSQIDSNIFKNVGANVAKYFGFLGSSQSFQSN